jgi:WD40 repeat protein
MFIPQLLLRPSMISHLRDVTAADRITDVAVSDDGSLLAVGTEMAVELFAVAAGKALPQIQLETAASGLAFSTDNRLLAVATDTPTVTVHNRESGEITLRCVRSTMPDFLREKRQRHVAFIPSTSLLITYGEGDTMAIWNCESSNWEHLIREHRWPNSSAVVAISHDGNQLAVVCEHT